MKTQAFIPVLVASILLSINVFAQKDTTEIKFGDKHLVIIDKKSIKARSIGNLEKGIVTFEEEIAKSEKAISELSAEVEKLEGRLEGLTAEEAEKAEKKINAKKAKIKEHEKKIEAFEKGIDEIEESIDELEEELDKLDDIGFHSDEFDKYDDMAEDEREKAMNRDAEFKGHWAGFEFGFAQFMNPDYALSTDDERGFLQTAPERSFGYAINFMEFNIPIHERLFGFTTGMGLKWESYALSENIDIIEDENGIIRAETVPLDVREYKKNRFNSAYLTIPAIAELQIPMGKHRFYVGAGVTGSVRAWSKQKQTYYIDNRKYKDKFVSDYQLSPFRYGATFRIGYGKIGLFANYSMIPLFKEGAGPELYPITVGVRILNL